MEQPNLSYIDQLADGCEDFKQEVILVLKKELPLEIKQYQEYINNIKPYGNPILPINI